MSYQKTIDLYSDGIGKVQYIDQMHSVHSISPTDSLLTKTK